MWEGGRPVKQTAALCFPYWNLGIRSQKKKWKARPQAESRRLKAGKKSETIGKWIKEAGQHAERLEEVLLKEYNVGPSQVDGLWSYVKNKGEKK